MSVRELLLERPWAAIKRQRIFRDPILRWFLLLAVMLLLVIWVVLAVQLRPTDFVVPFEYNSVIDFGRGPWYYIYSYGLFSLLVTVGNTILAAVSYEKVRVASFFLILGTIIINVFTLVIVYTLLAQVG